VEPVSLVEGRSYSFHVESSLNSLSGLKDSSTQFLFRTAPFHLQSFALSNNGFAEAGKFVLLWRFKMIVLDCHRI